MKRCLPRLMFLLGMVLIPGAHAAYVCNSSTPSVISTTGNISTGISQILEFTLSCTRAGADTKRNRFGVAYGVRSNDADTQAILTQTIGPTTYSLPFTVSPSVQTNVDSLSLSATTPATPACATTGAPSPLTQWFYNQNDGTAGAAGNILLFNTNSDLTTVTPRRVRICLYVPPPSTSANIPSGTYTKSLRLTSAITSSVSNQIGGSNAFTVSVTVTHSCSLASSLGTLSIPYTSFSPSAGTSSLPVSVSCSSGSAPWSAALSGPNTGTFRGVNYELGLGTTSTVSATNPLSTSLPGQVGTGTLYLHGRAAGGQVGSASCSAPCTPPSHALTITY